MRSFADLNLARRPFLNRRPVRRIIGLLWIVGVLLLAWNVWAYLQYRRDSVELRSRLESTRDEVELRSERIVALQEELRTARPQSQNSRVEFLNAKIAQRGFPWSVLFERLGTTLPPRVRLLSLNPQVRGAQSDRRRSGTSRDNADADRWSSGWVDLAFQGYAETDEDLYDLVDAFFDSPWFAEPKLANEALVEGRGVRFALDVKYLVDDSLEAPEAATRMTGAEGTAAGATAYVADGNAGTAPGEAAGAPARSAAGPGGLAGTTRTAVAEDDGRGVRTAVGASTGDGSAGVAGRPGTASSSRDAAARDRGRAAGFNTGRPAAVDSRRGETPAAEPGDAPAPAVERPSPLQPQASGSPRLQ